MPKATFFNLKEEKRLKIENALVKEFSRGTLEEASISNIVHEAGIPRGSFYQYFEDKEDAIKFIIQKFIDIEHENINNFLKQTNGNIFETAIKIYDYMVQQSLEHNETVKLVTNVLQELRKNNVNILDMKNKENEIMLINKEILNIQKEDDLYYIMRIIDIITRNVAIEVISGKLSIEQGKEELVRKIEILKRGMEK